MNIDSTIGRLLTHMLTIEASDLYLTAGSPPVYRKDGVGLAARAPLSADLGQAAESAIVGLRIHHAFVHGASKTNPPHSTRKPSDQSPDGLEH